MHLEPEQIENLRDDGVILLSEPRQWFDRSTHNLTVDLMNVLAHRGHALPFGFTDQDAVDAWHERRRAFLAEHNATEDKHGAAARVPVHFTEKEPVPVIGFYATTDQGRNAVLCVHPDDRVQYAWVLGQQAADACVERNANRRAYNRDMAHHD